MTKHLRTFIGLAGLVLLVTGGYLGLVWAPADRDMGDVQRIMYAHVPAVWGALLALTLQFVCSMMFLFKESPKTDAMSEAATEVGVILGAVGILLGSIWGRPTWGVWWTWDPRLTTAAILLVTYLGVMALRKFVDDPERRATWSAVAGVIAFVNIPIVWFSVRWWRSLHQIQSTPRTVDSEMSIALRVGGIAVVLLAVWFIWTRYRIAMKQRESELAMPERLPNALPNKPAFEGVNP